MKRIDIYRLWSQSDTMKQAVALGDTSILVMYYMEIIDFYENEKRKGNYHAQRATLDHFVIDLDYFRKVRFRMYQEVKI